MLEVADAADKECAHIEATGDARVDLVGDILGFFRFFCDGLHDPKEDGLLFARCHKRGMTDEDEPLEQMLGEHEWCSGELDAPAERSSSELEPGDREAALAFAARPARVRRACCAATSRSRRRSSSTRPSTTSPRRTGTSSRRSSRPCTTTRSRKACSPTGRSSPTACVAAENQG